MAAGLKVNMTLIMLAAVVLMLVGTSVLNVDAAKLDFFGVQTETSVSPDATGGTACCDSCPCTKSIPPQCHCSDIKSSCYKGCKSCLCTRSIPPQCRCTDVQNFCYKPCSTQN